jgi:hypothetical protein
MDAVVEEAHTRWRPRDVAIFLILRNRPPQLKRAVSFYEEKALQMLGE